MNGEMEELPEGWVATRISDVFDAWGGATPSTSNPAYWGGSLPWLSSKDVKHDQVARATEFLTDRALAETRLRICPPQSVLVVIRSGVLVHSLPIALNDRNVAINQDLKAFWSPEPKLNQWLALALRSREQAILSENRKDGTTVQSVRFDQLKNLSIPVPPLSEQKRIVAKVEALLAKVNSARQRLAKVPAILKRFRQAVLAAACSGRLTDDWREQNQRTQPSAIELVQRVLQARGPNAKARRSAEIIGDDSDSNGSPESWTFATVDTLSSKVVDGVHRKPNVLD